MANDDLRQAVMAINRVHGDGNLPPVPLSLRGNLVNEEGEPVDGLFRAEEVTDGYAMARSIQIRSGAPNRVLVVVHEIGHFLDVHGLPGTGFASGDQEVRELIDWRRAVVTSHAVETLTVLSHSPDQHVHRRATRLIDPTELWARSYTQFIATRSHDGRLMTSLSALRRPDSMARSEFAPSTVYFPRQWDDDDFDGIAFAIEALFRRLGWIA